MDEQAIRERLLLEPEQREIDNACYVDDVRHLLSLLDEARAAHAEVCREKDAAIKLRNLDTEFVCGFIGVVREGETRVPPILAEKWVEAAKRFLEEGRTEKVAVPSDESWKDTWERAEQAEAERDGMIAHCARVHAETDEEVEALTTQLATARAALERVREIAHCGTKQTPAGMRMALERIAALEALKDPSSPESGASTDQPSE